MFISNTIGDFPIYITTSDTLQDIPDDEPFFYQLLVTLDEEGKPSKVQARCESIPCSMCTLQSTCKDGQYVTDTLSSYFKDTYPELLV